MCTTKLKKDKKSKAKKAINSLNFNPCVNVYHPDKVSFNDSPIWTSVIDELF